LPELLESWEINKCAALEPTVVMQQLHGFENNKQLSVVQAQAMMTTTVTSQLLQVIQFECNLQP